jgi:tetratricopeptide (TPR) repeat protein
VERFEGFVDKFTGDGIMALFGAPIAHEDHAQRACHAALWLRDRLKRHGEELKRAKGLGFSVRMGINSGEVVVGKIGNDLRMDYTAQGHTVGLAQRMEQLADPGSIYLSEATTTAVSGHFRLRDLGAFELKGVRRPVRVHELEAAGPLRTRFEVSRARGLSKFVGRDVEMAMLETALERAMAGEGQIVGIVGEAGAGKSRLVHEFLERCRARSIRTAVAHCVAHGSMIPLLPIMELMRSTFGITDRDGEEDCRVKIAGSMLRADPGLSEDVAFMMDFLGVPDRSEPIPQMDPEARGRHLARIVVRLATARSGGDVLVAVTEDLHWIDGASEAVLLTRTQNAPRTGHLGIYTYRPEYKPPWAHLSHHQQLPLRPLTAESVDDLLHDLVGSENADARLVEMIRRKTGGNPFFIEEIVQSLVESGALVGTRGAYRLVEPVERLSVPSTVQNVLAARIDRLAEREKSVLQRTSVIGKTFSLRLIETIADLPAPDVSTALDRLVDAEFLYEESFHPEMEYSFKHPLTQEVAYESQLGEQRRRLHRALAGQLEDLYAERLDEKAALLAHHWEAAGEVVQAARWHRRAASWIGSRDGPAAVRHWRHVRELTASEELAEEAAELHLEACCQILGFSRLVSLSEDEVLSLFETGSALAKKRSDYRSLALLHGWLGNSRALDGKVDEYLQHAGEAVRLASKTDDRGLQLFIRIPETYSHYLNGHLEQALVMAKESLLLSGEDVSLGATFADLSPYIWFVMLSGYLGVEMGNLGAADGYLAQAVDLARRHGRSEILTWTLVERTILAQHKGESGDAERCAREALACADKMGGANQRGNALVGVGIAHNLDGNWRDAVEALEEALAISRQGRAFLHEEALTLIHLAEAYIDAGDSRRACEIARAATAVARRGNRMRECRAQLALSRALRSRDGAEAHEAIEAALERAAALVEETGARTYPPFIHAERAALAALLGDEAGRLRELRAAHRVFVAIGATGHAERLARELSRT